MNRLTDHELHRRFGHLSMEALELLHNRLDMSKPVKTEDTHEQEYQDALEAWEALRGPLDQEIERRREAAAAELRKLDAEVKYRSTAFETTASDAQALARRLATQDAHGVSNRKATVIHQTDGSVLLKIEGQASASAWNEFIRSIRTELYGVPL